MLLRFGYVAARFFAVLAISLQILLPGAVSIAHANAVDVGRFLCATPGVEPSAGAVETARQLAAVFGGEVPDETPPADDCSVCMLVQAATLPGLVLIGAPAVFSFGAPRVRYDPGFVYPPRGPPLGSRAPPRHI